MLPMHLNPLVLIIFPKEVARKIGFHLPTGFRETSLTIED